MKNGTTMSTQIPAPYKKTLGQRLKTEFLRNWQLYLLLILPIAYVITFSYVPILGLQIAFKNYRISQNMWDTPIHPNGMFYQFKRFFTDYQFYQIVGNTLILSLYQLVVASIMPVVLALVLNSLGSARYRKTVQFVTYAPHFISTVVMVGILMQILSMRSGFVNNLIVALGGERINFIARPNLFRHLYVWSGVWQETGYSAIIYLAALAGIDPQLHEAATVDGAGKFKRMIHIDIPGILPTVTIMMILAVGRMLNLGYEKAFLLMTPMNVDKSQIIDTYVYTRGMGAGIPGSSGSMVADYSYATAIGLFKSVISLILVVSVNKIADLLTGTSMW